MPQGIWRAVRDQFMINAEPIAPMQVVLNEQTGVIQYVNIDINHEAEQDYLRRQREVHERQKAADVRAKELLLRQLTPDRRELFERGYIDVDAKSGRRYRIDCRGSFSGNIYWVEGDKSLVRGKFCIYPDPFADQPGRVLQMPRHDAYLGQMLLIKHNEDKFLQVGVFHGPRHPKPEGSPGFHFQCGLDQIQRTW